MKCEGMIYLDGEFDMEKLTREILGEEGYKAYLAEREEGAKKEKARKEKKASRQLSMAEKNRLASKDYEDYYRAKRLNKEGSQGGNSHE